MKLHRIGAALMLGCSLVATSVLAADTLLIKLRITQTRTWSLSSTLCRGLGRRRAREAGTSFGNLAGKTRLD